MGCNGSKIIPQAVVPQEVPQEEVLEEIKPLEVGYNKYHIVWVNLVNHTAGFYTTLYDTWQEAKAEVNRLNSELGEENIVHGYTYSCRSYIKYSPEHTFCYIGIDKLNYAHVSFHKDELDVKERLDLSIRTLNKNHTFSCFDIYGGILRV